MRIALVSSLLLFAGLPISAQEWRRFEVDIPQKTINTELSMQEASARHARRFAPAPPEAKSLRESLSRLADALVTVQGARVSFERDRIFLSSRAEIFLLVGTTWVDVLFEFEPQVLSPNVIELRAVKGREQWKHREWETMTPAGLSSNLARLSEQVRAGLGASGTVRLERAHGDSPPRLVIDVSGVPELRGVEILGLKTSRGIVTLEGRTTRDALTLNISEADLNRGLGGVGAMPGLDGLMDSGARIDVGTETTGRITLTAKAKRPWLPEIPYTVVLAVERAGPTSLRLTLEDVQIGSDRLDRFLRGRLGIGIRRWILAKVFEQLNGVERSINRAYARGEVDVRMSHELFTPQVRVLELRRGRAADLVIRPGFEIMELAVERGSIRVTARLTPDSNRPEAPTAPPSRGLAGALGASAN